MELGLSFLTLLHLLIPIYWLGGDLGAFYGSRFMVDPARSVPERMMALKILNNIDMAPRTTLILALPTGFGLAVAKGWIDAPAFAAVGVWVLGLAWLTLAWMVHLKHGPAGAGYKRVDMGVRYVVLAGLIGSAIAGLTGAVTLPLFISLKLLALAVCIAIGLLVRRQLVPLFPAIIALREHGPTPEGDRTIAGVIAITQPTVIMLWIVVLIACLLGIATPV
ncbi:hypothetical protein [Rhizorhabdus sp. FW153]|uniref:hypothetical protein n=1 Tax=Rhizorhabdus sp. FW153 TaxID=3400216 RepID=UPI003CEF6874